MISTTSKLLFTTARAARVRFRVSQIVADLNAVADDLAELIPYAADVREAKLLVHAISETGPRAISPAAWGRFFSGPGR
jgi:hypothetical protein